MACLQATQHEQEAAERREEEDELQEEGVRHHVNFEPPVSPGKIQLRSGDVDLFALPPPTALAARI